MNVIEKTKSILTECPLITQFTNNVKVDFTDDTLNDFGISPTGDSITKRSITGKEVHRHNFVMYARKQSFTDFDRLQNSSFLLELSYYLNKLCEAPIPITANINDEEILGNIKQIQTANAMLFEVNQNDINKGCLYQLQIFVDYEIKP